jgi:hypothetical protein
MKDVDWMTCPQMKQTSHDYICILILDIINPTPLSSRNQLRP